MKMIQRENRALHIVPRLAMLLLVWITAVLPVHSQQENPVSLELSPNPVGRGDRFGVTILIDVEDSSTIDITQPELSGDIVLLRGPYVRPVRTTGPDGQEKMKTEITYLYRCDDTGRFEIGSYRIITPERIYSTEPLLLEVGIYRNRQLVIPLELQWDVQPSPAYVGQNVICILKALEQRDIRLFDDNVIESPSEGFFQTAEGVGEIQRYTLADVPLYEIPVESFVFTPSSEGPTVLPEAWVNWEGGQAVSRRVVIDVKPLPESVRKSGAVGDFKMSAKIDRSELESGQRISLTVRISGTGNLNYLQFPEIEASAFSVLEQDETTDYNATLEGYSGWRQYTYTLLAERSGPANIQVKSLTAMNTAEDRVYYVPGRSFPVRIMSPDTREEGEGDGDGFPFALVKHDEFETVHMSLRYQSWIEYLWLLPGPVVFLAFFFLKRRKAALTVLLLFFLSFSTADFLSDSSMVERLTAAEEAYQAEEYHTAELQYEELIAEAPDVPGLYFNAALSAYHQGKIGKAVLYTRTALVEQPMEQRFYRFLDYLDARYGIVSQIDPPFSFHPDFFFFLFGIFLNAAGFLGVFYLFKRKNNLFITGSLMLVISIVMLIGMSYSIHSSKNEIAVVMSSESEVCEVKKIPKSTSGADFLLQPGETVRIKGGAEQFYFISTSLGQKGWIRKSYVRIVPDIVDLSRTSARQM